MESALLLQVTAHMAMQAVSDNIESSEYMHKSRVTRYTAARRQPDVTKSLDCENGIGTSSIGSHGGLPSLGQGRCAINQPFGFSRHSSAACLVPIIDRETGTVNRLDLLGVPPRVFHARFIDHPPRRVELHH